MNDVTDGIRDYLASGGLFNPELMDHQRVRDLLIESRDEIERLRDKVCFITEQAATYSAEIERLRNDTTAYTEILADKQRHYDTLSKNAEQLFDQRTELLIKVNAQTDEIERLRVDKDHWKFCFDSCAKDRAHLIDEVHVLRDSLRIIREAISRP